ncbi:uncharacterized protein TNCT_32721 [Trichonephila clavata]|nr:uncharacterized protein TNCT_483341 [Trichonephila clavata]GFQ84382.1 uncharacterized protein TNCT_32721 [Trichonephila clavata]
MGTDRHENHTLSLGFSRAGGGAPDTAAATVLLREQRPYLLVTRFQGHELLRRKVNSSPGPPTASPSSFALPHLGHGCPYLRVREVNQDRLTHVQLLFTWNPSPCFSLRGSHSNICYYHQDLHRRRLQSGSRPDLLRAPPRPSYSFLRIRNVRERAGYGLDAGAPSIFRTGCLGSYPFICLTPGGTFAVDPRERSFSEPTDESEGAVWSPSEERTSACITRPSDRRGSRRGAGAAMCVRIISDLSVLQFTPNLAAGCVLHRPASRVIHCSELYDATIFIASAARRTLSIEFLRFCFLPRREGAVGRCARGRISSSRARKSEHPSCRKIGREQAPLDCPPFESKN